MGFFVMVFSMLLGILFVFISITRLRKSNKRLAFIELLAGIVLILLAVWLGLPK